MAEYKPSRDKIVVNGTLIDLDRAKRMIGDLENAIENAEYHREHIDDSLNIDADILQRLARDSKSEKIRFWVKINKEDDGSSVDEEKVREIAEEVKDDGYHYIVKVKETRLDELKEIDNVFFMESQGLKEPDT